MYQIDFKKPIHIHFMGIGGISMSGLAEILLKEGFTVSGSDIRSSDITEKLSSLGAKVFLGQVAENITDDIDLVVYTAAIHPENEEYKAALQKGIPLMKRATLLGQMMQWQYPEPTAKQPRLLCSHTSCWPERQIQPSLWGGFWTLLTATSASAIPMSL